MCGIAGLIDLEGRRVVPPGCLAAMARALVHRGPDDEGIWEQPGLGLASRRLSIVDLADGHQPMTNEDGSVRVVFNGELFDDDQFHADLAREGHRFRTHCDTELLPHLWEDHQEKMLVRLRGQFAVALWDERRQRLVLARDRFGICPLYWAERDGWLLFASEIKGLLASGLVEARPDRRGIDQVFCLMSLPGPVTCFAGVQALLPGHLLCVQREAGAGRANVQDRVWWDMEFPDAGNGELVGSLRQQEDHFEALLLRGVQRRLRADVPVGLCLSGGVDSSLVAAMASQVRGCPVPCFSIQIDTPGLDESKQIEDTAQRLGLAPVVRRCRPDDLLAALPATLRAAEGPTVDVSCAAVLLLSQTIHEHGYKVVMTGQGADDYLAGYVWFRGGKFTELIDRLAGTRLSNLLRRGCARLATRPFPWSLIDDIEDAVGGWNPVLDGNALSFLSRFSFYSPSMLDEVGSRPAHLDLVLPREQLRRWQPLDRGLYFGSRTFLAGMLLTAKGDLPSMHSSVEVRPPFLDEDLVEYCGRLPARSKVRRLRDKFVLRRVGQRWLPPSIAWRSKTMFRAPNDAWYAPGAVPKWVDQLLSEESLMRTGYFDPQAVTQWRGRYRRLPAWSPRRVSAELGLAAVTSTQLWHHLFIERSLADV
jgi:asparagine synthase (glutamine-hydrolysing)